MKEQTQDRQIFLFGLNARTHGRTDTRTDMDACTDTTHNCITENKKEENYWGMIGCRMNFDFSRNLDPPKFQRKNRINTLSLGSFHTFKIFVKLITNPFTLLHCLKFTVVSQCLSGRAVVDFFCT